MARSINGWEVITSYSDPRLATGRVPGTTVNLKMRRTVLRLFLALVADYHREVAKLRPRETGAFNPRQSALNPNVWSDHASGTAVDVNWGHEGAVGPNGGMKTMTNAQIKACARIKDRYEIVIWGGDKARGGDYRQSKYWDPMHFALKPGTTQADVDRMIKKLGIDKNGRRNGTSYGLLDRAKAAVATEAKGVKPAEQVVTSKAEPAKKTVTKLPQATYTVKKGDTLAAVAKKFGTTVAKLRKLNKISGNTILIGQKLKLR